MSLTLQSDNLKAGQGTLALKNLAFVAAPTFARLVAEKDALPAGSVHPADAPNFVQTYGLPCLVRDAEKMREFVVNVAPLEDFRGSKGQATPNPSPDGLVLNKFASESFSIRLRKSLEVSPFQRPVEDFYLSSITLSVKPYKAADSGKLKADYAALVETASNTLRQQVLEEGQRLIMKCDTGAAVLMRVTSVTVASLGGADGGADGAGESKAAFGPNPRGLVTKSTLVVLDGERGAITLVGDDRAVRTEALNLDFENMGIGGLNKEFEVIFRRAFASRVYPADVLAGLGITHVKGILLYGPPGCGKTLIARKIGEMLKARPPKIVNGPEILNKYVGASEENIRALFAEAEAEYEDAGDDSELHIIIMDEIDAICKARGSTSGGTGVSDNIVNQLLSKLDGAKQINNILLIGMTNRLDMIDSAILRPGRLEVHIEIGLPNEEGRLQILQIHTNNMTENGYLAPNVSLPTLAAELKNYTGAEIAGICRTAAAYTLKSQIDLSDIKSFKVDRSKLQVKMEHFRYAAAESKPAFGVKDDELKIFFRNGIIDYGDEYRQLKVRGGRECARVSHLVVVRALNCFVFACAHGTTTCPPLPSLFFYYTRFPKQSRLDAVVNQVRVSDRTPLMTVCLSGPPGSGRTALAAHVAQSCGFPFAKMITADMLIGYTERGKIEKIHKVFEDAAKTPLGVIVLDDLERILSYVDAGPNFSNPMLQALLVMLNKPPKEKGRRVLIIATTTIASRLERLGLTQRFNITIDVPAISRAEEFATVMQEWADMPPALAAQVAAELPEPIPIKRLLMVLEMARQSTETGQVTPEALQECLFNVGYRSLEGLGLDK